ncbi:MAG: type II toxin-antitoxin system HicB family antitoxin [Devosia sp.]
MARYLALIDFADGQYGVAFPDAPGCTAMGSTQEEAIRNAAEALAEWIGDELADGRKPPRPSAVPKILADKQVGRALAKGAILAFVPLVRDTGKLARANISIDAGLLADIDETARRGGVTRSAFLAAAAREKIKASA